MQKRKGKIPVTELGKGGDLLQSGGIALGFIQRHGLFIWARVIEGKAEYAGRWADEGDNLEVFFTDSVFLEKQ